MSMVAKLLPAGKFKQGCLALIDDVAATGQEVIITKRGRPLAKLVSLVGPEQREQEILATLRGQTQVLVDDAELLQPLTEEAGWDLGDESTK